MVKKVFDTLVIGAGAAASFLFGEPDGLFYALVALVILDYITGVIAAVVRKDLSSEIGFKGICKKLVIFMVVALANIIDTEIIKNGAVLRTAALFLFISNEGISLLENAEKMGLPIPKKLLSILRQLKAKANHTEEVKGEKGDE